MTHASRPAWLALPLAAGILLLSCERESRRFHEAPPSSGHVATIKMSELQPGTPVPPPATVNQYEKNAWAVSEGKRLYGWYNCSGCHSQGGGGMGPPLMDDEWIYGSDPANIFATIVEGRPNGMPSFRGRIPDDQVWKLVAYVRSLSGQVAKDVSPGRDDDMSGRVQEQSKDREVPKQSQIPPASQESRSPGRGR
jgi:cytochrome c oxidase cbb3-type subunit 3